MKAEVAVPVPNNPCGLCELLVSELCESRGGRPGLPVPNSPCGLCELLVSELRSCVKVEVAVLGSPSLIVLVVTVDVKQH